MSDKNPRYARILLKLSGEALAGSKDMGIDTEVLDKMSLSIAHLRGLGVQVGIVVGGGNLYRGAQLQKEGLVGRVTGDQMGMLATVMNGLAMRDALDFSLEAFLRIDETRAQTKVSSAFQTSAATCVSWAPVVPLARPYSWACGSSGPRRRLPAAAILPASLVQRRSALLGLVETTANISATRATWASTATQAQPMAASGSAR